MDDPCFVMKTGSIAIKMFSVNASSSGGPGGEIVDVKGGGVESVSLVGGNVATTVLSNIDNVRSCAVRT